MINKENKGKAEELQQLRVNKYNESVEENDNCVPLLSKKCSPIHVLFIAPFLNSKASKHNYEYSQNVQ